MKLDVFPSMNTFEAIQKHLLVPVTGALLNVEENGFRVDREKLKSLSTSYLDKIETLESDIRSYPEIMKFESEANDGNPLNLNSPQQKSKALYKYLRLSTKGLDLTDEGMVSTKKENLELLRGKHPAVDSLIEHTKYSTLYKMFVKPTPAHICDDDRVHCSYKIHGTVTGRLASEAPNMQQIPKNIKSDDVGFEFDKALNIKHMFIASSADHVILQADYSQMELKILAEYSQDPDMVGAFQRGEDIHLATGSKMAGETITEDSFWRSRAKAINFGIVYGKGVQSLAVDLGVTEKEAQSFIDNYMNDMPMVRDCIDGMKEYCKEHQFVTSMFGRVRRLTPVKAVNKWIREEALRKAVNMPIQSTASDYTLCSLINIVDLFQRFKLKSKIVATVHDSILVDTHRKELKTVADIMNTVMPKPKNPLIYWDTVVPFTADIEVGDRWSELEKYQN